MTRYRWVEPQSLSELASSLCGPPLLQAIAVQRGLASAEEFAQFLEPSLASLADPGLLPEMALAVERIERAIREGRSIAIFGDYDVDGITSTALLKRTLDRLGARSSTFLPHRERDGYGLNRNAIDQMIAEGVSLLVALDCGTKDGEKLAYAHESGLETIVVDHHHVGDLRLPGTAFVSPQRPDSEFPFRQLAAVGVTYYLVRALLGDAQAAEMLPFVALGTVADVVPLIGENRVLVAEGLRRFAADAVIGLQSLAQSASLDPAQISSYHCGFVLGPRINAAGRMDDPRIALELLLTDDRAAAERLAAELGRLNAQRQQLVRAMVAEAEEKAEHDGDVPPFLVACGNGWSIGLVGLVASRLTDRYYRPSLALSVGDEFTRGSARSVAEFNIVEALDCCKDLLVAHGGHSQAAGLTMRTANIGELERRLIALSAQTFGSTPPLPAIMIDAELPGHELTLKTARLLTKLEPVGQGNPAPCFLIRAVTVRSPRRTRDGKHLQFDIETPDYAVARAIYFNGGHQFAEFQPYERYDLVVQLKLDTWKGRTSLGVEVLDFRPAEPSPAAG